MDDKIITYLAVDKDGTECICEDKPSRQPAVDDGFCYDNYWDTLYRVNLPPGTIRRLIGKDMTWADEPIEFSEDNLLK